MTPKEIQEKVNFFLVDRLEYEQTIIRPEADLKEDLGMTSLDAVETSIFIRKNFGFQPERGAIRTLKTLQNLYDYIEQNLREKPVYNIEKNP